MVVGLHQPAVLWNLWGVGVVDMCGYACAMCMLLNRVELVQWGGITLNKEALCSQPGVWLKIQGCACSNLLDVQCDQKQPQTIKDSGSL